MRNENPSRDYRSRTVPLRPPSRHEGAAVHMDRLPGHVARLGRTQEAYHRGDLASDGLDRSGTTMLTVVLAAASSFANARVSPTMPAFAVIACTRPTAP